MTLLPAPSGIGKAFDRLSCLRPDRSGIPLQAVEINAVYLVNIFSRVDDPRLEIFLTFVDLIPELRLQLCDIKVVILYAPVKLRLFPAIPVTCPPGK